MAFKIFFAHLVLRIPKVCTFATQFFKEKEV
jgi:hypothetical protein